MRVRRRMGVIALAVVALAASGLAACTDDGTDDEGASTTGDSAPPAVAHPVAATELVAGDCLTGLVIGADERVQIDSASVVACEAIHDLEVFEVFTLTPEDVESPDDSYPGQQRIVDAADTGCDDRLDEVSDVEETADELGLIAIWPTQQSWIDGDRDVACAVYSTTGERFEGRGILAER